MQVSVVIPCRNAEEAELTKIKCAEQGAEVIVVEGKEAPGRLRDKGVRLASGDIIAFIDSDAYPAPGWVNRIMAAYLMLAANPEVFKRSPVAICGPGVIPPNSPFREKLSDWVLRGMPYAYRVRPGLKMKVVREFPTFNLVMLKNDFSRIGGFDSDMITGEDTLLCNKINQAGGEVIYIPNLIVFHKRRAFGLPFFRQIARYGFNRGFLIGLAFPLLPVAYLLTLIWYGIRFLMGVVTR